MNDETGFFVGVPFGDYLGWADIAEDMESEIEGLLRETPAENWPA